MILKNTRYQFSRYFIKVEQKRLRVEYITAKMQATLKYEINSPGLTQNLHFFIYIYLYFFRTRKIDNETRTSFCLKENADNLKLET